MDDIDRVSAVLSDLEVWRGSMDDGCTEEMRHKAAGFFLGKSEYVVYSPNENTVFILHPHNSITFEIHTNITKDGRGPQAAQAALQVLQYVFTETPCRKVISYVPEFNRLALRFAVRAGMKVEGKVEKSFAKLGKLYDEIIVGITQEEWLCQQQQ